MMTIDVEKDLNPNLNPIINALERLGPLRPPWRTENSIDLISQGDRLIACYEDWLLDDEQSQTLRRASFSRHVLYAATYLSDIGFTEGNGLAPVDARLSNTAEASVFSASLNLRSAKLIQSNWKRLGIAGKRISADVANVCQRATGTADAKTQPLVPEDGRLRQTDGIIDLLAACLRLGRALDLKSPATVLHIHQRLKKPNSLSVDAIANLFRIEAVGPHPYLRGTIRLSIRCVDAEVHRALKHYERFVQQLLEHLNQRIRPRFLFSDLIFEIEPQGYTPIDLKFEIDSSAGLQLFMGNRLYSDKRVFLRELIQNAVDACNYRKFIDPDYSPAITIEFNQDISAISIRDNGIGMTRQWIEKYFLSIGISFYQSDEIRNANQDARFDFGFISQFGIGFLSSFQVAEKIHIKTRKASAAGLSISISGLRDYFDVRVVADDFPVGTSVTLHLQASERSYCRRMEFAGYLKTNIRFLNVPVTLKEKGARTLTIGREKLAYDTDKRAGTMFVSAVNLPDSEGYLRLGAKDNGSNIYALDSASGGVSIFQDGIFVTQVDELLPEGARNYVVSRINLMGQDKCDLSMDRNRMFWTPAQLKSLKKVIRLALVEVANQLLAAVQAQDVSDNTLNSIVNHLSIFFDFAEVDDQMHRELNARIRSVVEKRFRDFVRVNFAHTLRTAGIPEADGYNEAWQRQVLASFVKFRQ